MTAAEKSALLLWPGLANYHLIICPLCDRDENFSKQVWCESRLGDQEEREPYDGASPQPLPLLRQLRRFPVSLHRDVLALSAVGTPSSMAARVGSGDVRERDSPTQQVSSVNNQGVASGDVYGGTIIGRYEGEEAGEHVC